jgi:hypothetical protein
MSVLADRYLRKLVDIRQRHLDEKRERERADFRALTNAAATAAESHQGGTATSSRCFAGVGGAGRAGGAGGGGVSAMAAALGGHQRRGSLLALVKESHLNRSRLQAPQLQATGGQLKQKAASALHLKRNMGNGKAKEVTDSGKAVGALDSADSVSSSNGSSYTSDSDSVSTDTAGLFDKDATQQQQWLDNLRVLFKLTAVLCRDETTLGSSSSSSCSGVTQQHGCGGNGGGDQDQDQRNATPVSSSSSSSLPADADDMVNALRAHPSLIAVRKSWARALWIKVMCSLCTDDIAYDSS